MHDVLNLIFAATMGPTWCSVGTASILHVQVNSLHVSTRPGFVGVQLGPLHTRAKRLATAVSQTIVSSCMQCGTGSMQAFQSLKLPAWTTGQRGHEFGSGFLQVEYMALSSTAD